MAVKPRQIKDRVAIGDDLYFTKDNGDGRKQMIPYPDEVIEAGTKINHALLQPIEDRTAFLFNRAMNDASTNTFSLSFEDETGYTRNGGFYNASEQVVECTNETLVLQSDVMSINDQPEQLNICATYSLPFGATMKLEVTNNGNDSNPVWEDATAYLTSGRTYDFVNAAKTAGLWGFVVRLTIVNPTTTIANVEQIWGNFYAEIQESVYYLA